MADATTMVDVRVDFSKVDESKVYEAHQEFVGGAKPATIEDAVNALQTFFAKKAPKGGLLECEVCGGGSTSDFDRCPFCGAIDDDEEEDLPPPAKAKANGTKSLAIAGVGLHAGKADTKSLRTVKELDRRVVAIKEIQARGTRELYLLGKELHAIYTEELWRQRTSADGKVAYKSFVAFVEAEIDMHPRTAWNLMGIVQEFLPAQLEKHGPAVLRGLLAAPKEDRQHLLEKVERGELKGKRGVAREVEEIRKRKGVSVVANVGDGKQLSPRGQAAKKAAEASSKGAKEKKAQVVTCPFPVGRKRLETFATPLRKGDPPKRARSIKDRPWGKLELQNGVVVHARAELNAAGEVFISIEARRDE